MSTGQVKEGVSFEEEDMLVMVEADVEALLALGNAFIELQN